MTKAELIKKFARNSSVPDSEAKIFFEVFLRKLASHLNIKQSIKINDIGYFELKKDSVKSKEGKLEIDVICFSEYKESGEQLFFYIPDEPEQYSSLDSYFSPSFGKPIIPIEGVSNNELFITHSGTEYEKLLESKADKLLAGTRVTEGIEKEFQKDEKKEINWKSVPLHFKEESQSELEETTSVEDSESISWNFGEGSENDDETDLDKPVQTSLQEWEDKIEDTASSKAEGLKDENEIQDTYPEDKVNVFDEDEQTYPKEIEQSRYEADAVEIQLEQKSEEIEKAGEPFESGDNPPDLEEIKPSLFSIDDYEKVEPVIAPLLAEDQELVSEEDIPFDKDEETIFDEEGYARVTPKVASLLRIKEGEEKILESPANKTGIPLEEDISEEPVYEKEEIEEESNFAGNRRKSKPRRSLVVIGVLAAIVVIGGGIYLYTNYFGEKSFDTVITPPKVRDKSRAIIIERSYDYPVTYPYNKNTIVGLFNGINPDLLKTTLIEKQPLSISSVPEIETYEARPSKFVKGYIFKYDDFYAVQVSSWKSLSIAKSEMMKYKNGGLDAFIEEAQVKGSKYYRVRVGFKTLEEVEAYLAK